MTVHVFPLYGWLAVDSLAAWKRTSIIRARNGRTNSSHRVSSFSIMADSEDQKVLEER